ncbi:hypothetical protein ACIREK_31385 [Streptomyces sp. NPDC102415]|uniref:hypothetical protein n=1 Tax=Streptomyces sp. NPDC102415 TaxID=3366173 RepID=UPI003826A72D
MMLALVASPHATHVLLGTNSLGNEGACSVAGTLRRGGDGLRTAHLGCNRIGAEGAATLAQVTGVLREVGVPGNRVPSSS